MSYKVIQYYIKINIENVTEKVTIENLTQFKTFPGRIIVEHSIKTYR